MAELIDLHGEKNWAVVSKELKKKFGFYKTGKQCRERWNNNLSPEISKDSWTAEEEKILFDLHKIHGNKWSVIAAEIKGRTDNSTKNHFYSIVRKNLRKFNKSQPVGKKLTENIQTLLVDPALSKILLKRPRHYIRKNKSKKSSEGSSKASTRRPSRSSALQSDPEVLENTLKSSNSASKTPSRRQSRANFMQIDPEVLEKTLKSMKPRPKIGMRRTSTNSEYSLLPSKSRKGSVCNLEVNTEAAGGFLSPLSPDNFGVSASNSQFFQPIPGPHLPNLDIELKTPTERSLLTGRSSIRTNSIKSIDLAGFSRRESRNNTGESMISNLDSCRSSQNSWASKIKSLVEVEKEVEKKRMFNFNIPEYSLSETFQFKKSPRAQS